MIPERVWRGVCQHYNARNRGPYRRVNAHSDSKLSSSMKFKEKPTVFMNHKVTARLVRSQIILEKIPTAQRLFQYLNWTMRINKMATTTTVLEGRDGAKVLLFDVELHGPRGQRLYALCTPNDVISPNAQPWQLADLWTASQITKMLGIRTEDLPRGVRTVSSQFEQYRTMNGNDDLKRLKRDILALDERQSVMRYHGLKCIRTGNAKREKVKSSKSGQPKERVLTVKLSTFYEKVHCALMDETIDLVPIVSIVSNWNKQRDEKDLDFRYYLVRR